MVTLGLQTIGAVSVGETPSAADLQLGFTLLNEFVDSWNIKPLTLLLYDRHEFDLVADQGGPDNPYTIGPGGDFDTGTAARPDEIAHANLLLNTTSPYPTEIPLAILTDDMYAANPIKTITNAQPQTLYYQRSVPLGQIQLWNIPNTAANQLVLYYGLLTTAFADVNTLYVCPPGYHKAFRYCLSEAMLLPFSAPDDITVRVTSAAREAVAELEQANFPMTDLVVDPMFTPTNHGTYIIQTDTGA